MLLAQCQSERWPVQPGALLRQCRGAAQEAGTERQWESPEGWRRAVRWELKTSRPVDRSAWRWHVQTAPVGYPERHPVLAWLRVESPLVPRLRPSQCRSRTGPWLDRATVDKWPPL